MSIFRFIGVKTVAIILVLMVSFLLGGCGNRGVKPDTEFEDSYEVGYGEEILRSFINDEIECIDESKKFSEIYEEYISSGDEIYHNYFDVDEDDEKELLILTEPDYGYDIYDARNGKVYLLIKGSESAERCDLTKGNGHVYVHTSGSGGGWMAESWYRYDSKGEVIEKINLRCESEEMIGYDENSKFYCNDNEISMKEFEEIENKYSEINLVINEIEPVDVKTGDTDHEISEVEETESTDDENKNKLIDYTSLTTHETITIYDIEDGYMEVPYYPELPQSEYDWSKLKLDGQILKYNDTRYETALGVDVSKFQGDVDWDKVAAQGFDFAIIRLGYRGYGNGALVTDEFFEKNIKSAQASGLEVGVYFLSQAKNDVEAVEEAEYAVSELGRCSMSKITYPIVIDSEKIKFDTSRTESMNGAERTDTVIAFCKAVEDAGYESALYANSQWLTKELDIRRLTDINIWYADYQIVDNDEAPLYPYPFTIWQYTNTGKVDGISGDVDINIHFKEKLEVTNSNESIVDSIIASMSVEDKVYQLFVVTPEQLTRQSIYKSAGDETRIALEKHPVGGLIFFASNISDPIQTKEMLSNIQSYAEIIEDMPLLLSVDEEGGQVVRLAENEAFKLKNVGAMANIKNSEDAYSAGAYIGDYLNEYGFNLDFAPDTDVLTNTSNKVIGKRSFGSDPEIVAEFGKAYSNGLHSAGILSCFKHFPGHGATLADTHKGYAFTDKSYEELLDSELLPFVRAKDYGIDCIMAAHISLPNVLGDDTPCSLSKEMITGVLRNKFGFNGLVITDALNMGAITQNYISGEAAKKAFLAGCDLLLMPEDLDASYSAILEAVKSGEITEGRLDESLRRIIKVKLQIQ